MVAHGLDKILDMAVRTVLAIQTLFLVVLSEPESLPELELVTSHFLGTNSTYKT